jgi:hypothetical protein
MQQSNYFDAFLSDHRKQSYWRCKMKMLWHRLVSRHKRIKAEVAQLELEIALEMAKGPPLLRVLPAFPQKPYKTSTVILFSVFTFFVTISVWISFRELIVPLFR